MRESGKKIYLPGFSTSDESEWTFENFATGFVLYDFSGTDAAIVGEYGMGEGHTYYNSFVFSNVVKIDGVDCRKYIYSTGNGVFAVIEGVGYAGSYGDLLRPNPDGGLPTCPCDFGLACLEDSDGKVLYKGSGYGLYMNFLRTICDFTGDGKVDVSDLSAAIDAAVGKTENGKADVNCDGRVDIADVNTVLNVMLNAR